MTKAYTDEFLISELHRFKRENGRVPVALDMQGKFGYPSYMSYVNRFGSFNNGIEVAELKINNKHQTGTLDGTEVCSYCGMVANEIPNFTSWSYDKDGNRYCRRHGAGGLRDYVKGNLDINSNVGIGKIGENLVRLTLNIDKKFDCNMNNGFTSSFDIYDKNKYGKIDVKTSLYSFIHDNWIFGFNAKKEANTYICIGLSSDRKFVQHVWIVPNIDEIRDLTRFTIRNTYRSLYSRNKWEVDSEPYNSVWENMSLDKCEIMVDKSR